MNLNLPRSSAFNHKTVICHGVHDECTNTTIAPCGGFHSPDTAQESAGWVQFPTCAVQPPEHCKGDMSLLRHHQNTRVCVWKALWWEGASPTEMDKDL